jgi:hydrogenase nickel incorporation protein HypB
MGSPGSGKTSLILALLRLLGRKLRIAVIESDLDSTVDADKIVAAGYPAVQLETGGFCHTSAAMTEKALELLDPAQLDLIFLENVGNLVCPAESDCGAHLNLVILSVPEGDDKPLKYPLIFRMADGVILGKTDYLDREAFDTEQFWGNVRILNPAASTFEVSCRTGAGLEQLADWMYGKVRRQRA